MDHGPYTAPNTNTWERALSGQKGVAVNDAAFGPSVVRIHPLPPTMDMHERKRLLARFHELL